MTMLTHGEVFVLLQTIHLWFRYWTEFKGIGIMIALASMYVIHFIHLNFSFETNVVTYFSCKSRGSSWCGPKLISIRPLYPIFHTYSNPCHTFYFYIHPPSRRQSIIWTKAGILLIWSLGTNFSEFLSESHIFKSRKCIWKCRLRNGGHFCVGLNMLSETREGRL